MIFTASCSIQFFGAALFIFSTVAEARPALTKDSPTRTTNQERIQDTVKAIAHISTVKAKRYKKLRDHLEALLFHYTNQPRNLANDLINAGDDNPLLILDNDKRQELQPVVQALQDYFPQGVSTMTLVANRLPELKLLVFDPEDIVRKRAQAIVDIVEHGEQSTYTQSTIIGYINGYLRAGRAGLMDRHRKETP